MWAKENGCPKPENSEVCAIAAYRGNVLILEWAVKEGFLLDEGVFKSAAFGGNTQVLSWLTKMVSQ
ncbi:Ankyrin repeat-containing protein [Cedratvirus Zaza IHUMI]|uniref:Ankyrin repeat-containing protein n=1 Tax=Cedratvirus Zaza IHUMI TaxID=2126979 RepID=A0A2R8FEV5_9VIRU|nr:Ankyrin repeat-containing protein [Cedratvirus Zaza IHUMI]